MPGMTEPMHHSSSMEPKDLADIVQEHASSGTSLEPLSTPMSMVMTHQAGWMWMVHGEAFLNAVQQSGPRGGDKVFSTNWIMPMAQRELGPGTLTLRTMLSLEPATVTGKRYPELLQTGETAYGKPIVDGQHPHDLFMEIAALYDWKLNESTLLSFYAAPIGDPAIGPTAYPHRASAAEDPLAPLGHHFEDSTHIASDVLTAGVTYRRARLELSGFHGREPDEYRWNIDQGGLDSWATRLTISATKNWIAQVSAARIASPEAFEPGRDQLRMTASVSYNRENRRGDWASTLLWGRVRPIGETQPLNGFLAESTLRFASRNYVWGRVENLDRTAELTKLPDAGEAFYARVQAFTAGYSRDIAQQTYLRTSLGAQLTYDHVPSSLTQFYGRHPLGVAILLRIRLQGDKM